MNSIPRRMRNFQENKKLFLVFLFKCSVPLRSVSISLFYIKFMMQWWASAIFLEWLKVSYVLKKLNSRSFNFERFLRFILLIVGKKLVPGDWKWHEIVGLVSHSCHLLFGLPSHDDQIWLFAWKLIYENEPLWTITLDPRRKCRNKWTSLILSKKYKTKKYWN